MRNRILAREPDHDAGNQQTKVSIDRNNNYDSYSATNDIVPEHETASDLAGILFITSYPPRECGIATYSQDLIRSLNNKFSNSFSIKVCALESGVSDFQYPHEVKYILDTSNDCEYKALANKINNDDEISIVLIQHEFGFYKEQEDAFVRFLYDLTKPVIVAFHTVLPHPDEKLKLKLISIAAICENIIVMTNYSSEILTKDYGLPGKKISVIAHGTHLVAHLSEKFLKIKYGLKDRRVLSTFGLLSSGKSIETTIDALPEIIQECPDVLFLVIGKTHPEVVKSEGEQYRDKLKQKVTEYGLHNHVRFINSYLALPELLEYLQLTDVYLFTTNDPNQAVSGTFAYAMSCACPIISTPIPHAVEVLTEETGIIIDFRNSKQLALGVLRLLNDEPLKRNISTNTLQTIAPSAWENSAVAHAMLLESITPGKIKLQYNLPAINLNHIKQMTTNTGIIQFSKINQPDIDTGYTLDDNARALVAMCMYYKLSGDKKVIHDIGTYLNFIKLCQQPSGNFLNYVDKYNIFSAQNYETNLDDSNGRAIWALGYLLSLKELLPAKFLKDADAIIRKSMYHIVDVHSTRAMAFTIKGLYYYHNTRNSSANIVLLKILADRMVQMYRHESTPAWAWFEPYLTYANSILPEAMLYAWLITGETKYRDVACSSLEFLLSQTFSENGIEVISNRNWLKRGELPGYFGEQPIDVAYTIMTLSKFYDVFWDEDYYLKMETAFNWFLGKNRLHQIVYNPCTGGCYDGLEEMHVNLNQGAESTLSYLLARLTMDEYKIV